VALARLDVSAAFGGIGSAAGCRSGLRTGADDGEGASNIDSDMCTLTKDIAGFWPPCWSLDGTLRLKMGLRADCIAVSYV
jgi:hypothetical protein